MRHPGVPPPGEEMARCRVIRQPFFLIKVFIPNEGWMTQVRDAERQLRGSTAHSVSVVNARMRAMIAERCTALVIAGPGGRAIVVVPFDPDKAWGAKAAHHVNGTVNGHRVRVTLSHGDSGWAFTLSPSRVRDLGVAAGDEVIVQLTPEGPQRVELAEDISAALAANPAAGAFFDTLAQFYRRAYLRYIDATTRRPELRAARIAEVVELLAAGTKERPRS
jgi:hypothetical protein